MSLLGLGFGVAWKEALTLALRKMNKPRLRARAPECVPPYRAAQLPSQGAGEECRVTRQLPRDCSRPPPTTLTRKPPSPGVPYKLVDLGALTEDRTCRIILESVTLESMQ